MGTSSGKTSITGLAVLLMPVLEILAFAVVAGSLGVLRTIALFIALSAVGVWIFRRRMVGMAVAQQRGGSIGSAVLGLLGAVLIMIPGIVTAIVGGLLQIGPIRSMLAGRVTAQFTSSFQNLGGGVFTAGGPSAGFGPAGFGAGFGDPFGARGDVIDADIVESDVVEAEIVEDDQPPRSPSSPELT